LDVTADCVVLGESWRLSAVGSVTTFPEILQLSVIALAGTNLLLYVTLRVINSPVRVVMIVACAATHLIWTIPLVPRSTHPLQIIVRYVRCFLLVIISSDTDAIYMLGLSFANNCANWLRHVVRTHRWILLPSCSIILIEIHLIHITDAVVLSHLVLWRHWHCCILVCWSIRRLVHHLHLLITEVAHFIVMHIWSVRRERTIYNLITVWNIVVKISTTLLVKVSIDGHVGTTGATTVSGAVTAQSRAHAARRDVAVAFWILCTSLNRHFLRLSVAYVRIRLLNLLVILVLLQISVSLRVGEILLIWIGWETAGHSLLVLSIKTVLDINSLVVYSAVCVIHFLYTARRGRERVRINLWVVPSGVVWALNHIKSPIRLR
jgi:hypothetical protein